MLLMTPTLVSVTLPQSPTRLHGTVRLAAGPMPTATHIANTTDPDVCGDGRTLEDIQVSPSRGIANVIITVRDAPAFATRPETLVLDNVDCRFEPHAAVIPVGSTIEARNSDAVLHTTHLYGPREINISLPIRGMTSSRVLDQPGLYAVKCDIHGWMQAFIRVDRHPFHAVTDADGRFAIDGLPPGDFVLDIWHEKLGPLELAVVAGTRAATGIEIEYAP